MSKQMEKSALGQKSSGVVLKEITKIFQQPDTGKDFVAVDHINLNIQDGEMVTLLGPSGCGKTTTLRMISWLDVPHQRQACLSVSGMLPRSPPTSGASPWCSRATLCSPI